MLETTRIDVPHHPLSDDVSTAAPLMRPKQARVALLIDTATTWGSGLIEGVVSYANARKKNWLFSLEPRGKYDPMMLPEGWRGDGVVARITHAALAEQLINRRIPAVNVSWFRFGENLIPRCTCDEAAAATMAAEYFLASGFRQFAYCPSMLRPAYQDRLGAAFALAVEKAGYACHSFEPRFGREASGGSERQLTDLSEWLRGLPRPVALLAFDDLQARQVSEACMLSGLCVPDDIAVLGGEHDELCSRISSPPLSGVDQGPLEVGYHAAEMLDRLMRGEPLAESNVLLPPRRIIARPSTDKVAIDDDLLSEAIRYIRAHFADELRIRDILHAVPLSRRALEIGFRRYLGRTPREEIRRVRVQRALELLCDTDWPVTRIASICGFDRPELLTRAFRRELRATPTEFRKRVASRRASTDAAADR